MEADAFATVTSPSGQLVGVAVGFPDHPHHIFHLSQLLTTAPCLKQFVGLFKQRYPGYTITAHRWRDGKRVPVVYKTQRLCQLLEAIC